MLAPSSISPDLAGLVPASAIASVRLRLEATGSHQGMLDGGWWPRSRRAFRELPSLVLRINGIRGQVLRLVLATTGWDDRPRRLAVGGRWIIIDYFSSQPASLLTAICVRSRVDLLVIPPGTGRATAHAAMLLAMTTGNRVAAGHAAVTGGRVSRAHMVLAGSDVATRENEGGHLPTFHG